MSPRNQPVSSSIRCLEKQALKRICAAHGAVNLITNRIRISGQIGRRKPRVQRTDSVHIKSSMRRSGRIGIFSESVHKFPVNLKRNQPGALSAVDSGIIERPLTANAFAGTGERGYSLNLSARYSI
jgi:hypothetical protein